MATREGASDDGWQHLVGHLLERSSLPTEVRALARSLLLVDGLRPLHLTALDGHPPLALWRSSAHIKGGSAAAQILLLDLGGAGTATAHLPLVPRRCLVPRLDLAKQ